MSLGKIILKSTTKMSLNDRFTVLRQEKPSHVQGAALVERRQQAQASRKNQRLAAQMERRPSVISALNLKKKMMKKKEGGIQKQNSQVQQKKVSIKQRLAIEGRLSFNNDNFRKTNVNNRGRGRIRVLRGAANNMRPMNNRGSNFRGGRVFINNKGGGASRGTGNYTRTRGNTVRGNLRGGGGRGSGFRNQGAARGGTRNSFTGRGGQGTLRMARGRGRRGRGRGGRSTNNQNGEIYTREQLDSQIEEYMNKNRVAMDGEIDVDMHEI